MIITRLIGGLGNQMFQYAAGRALSLRMGVELKVDTSGFETYGLRRYELGAYPIAAEIASPEELALVGGGVPAPRSRWRSVLHRWIGGSSVPSPALYREPHFPFDADLARQSPPIYMDGYWQSERYFSDVAEILRRDLTPREPLDPVNAETASEIVGSEAVSLHVRRGDYVTNAHTNAYHGTCSLDYYRAAIEHIGSHVASPRLFVFSDDADWTRKNLNTDLPTTYVSANPPDRGFRDIQLMSLCRHHVIANSSFSWWGAWLNPRSDKIVVAPSQWFAAGGNDTRDLVPDRWVRI